MTARLELNFPNPVERPTDLFDRSSQLELIQDTVVSTARRIALIMGERVTGKTSLLHVVQAWATAQPGLAVLRLPPVISRNALIEEILEGMASEADTSLHQLGYRGARGEFTRSTVIGFAAVAAELSGRTGRTFLVCLDELDSMLVSCSDNQSAAEILDFIMYVNDTSLPIRFVFTLSRVTPQIMRADVTPFVTAARIADLAPWSKPETREFVEGLLSPSIVVDDSAHELLFAEGGGHPYFTKAILQSIVDTAAEVAPSEVSAEHVRDATLAALATNEVYFTLQNIVTVHFSPDEALVLQRLAKASAPLTVDRFASTMSAFSELRRRHYVRQEAGGFVLAFGLLGRWLSRQDFMASKVSNQSQPFRKKPNPYVFGVHVQDHRRFFGRRSELNQLLGHVAHASPQNLLLWAPRRAGKTSLLHMMRSVLADKDRQAGVRDWFDVPCSWDDKLNATIPMLLNLQGIEALQQDPTQTAFYRAVLSGLREAEPRGSVSDRLLGEPTISYTQFTRSLRQLVTAASPYRPVILLDEFDVLDRMVDKFAFYSALRSVIADVQGITWILVSALGLHKEILDYASPLFNIFKIVTMGRINAEEAGRLVTSPWEPGGSLADAQLTVLPDAVFAILEEAGYQPYFIQMLCSEVVDFVNIMQSNLVWSDTVQQVIDGRMLAEGGAADLSFDYMWHGSSPTGKLLLLTLLHQDIPMAHDELKAAACRLLKSQGRADLVRTLLARYDDSLSQLTDTGAVRHVAGAGYAFSVPVFRRLLVRKVERINLEAATIGEIAASLKDVGP